MATEIVALGHKRGIVILADKRTVSRRDSFLPVQHDTAIKIAQLEKNGVIAFAGIAQIVPDRKPEIDLFEELAKLVPGKQYTADEDRKILIEQLNSQYQRAPFNLLASNVKRNPSIAISGRVLYPLYSLLFITLAPDKQCFNIAQASIYFEDLKNQSFDCPYEILSTKYCQSSKDNQFVSIMGARSSEAKTLEKYKPENHVDALRLAASEIKRTHHQRHNEGINDVGSTCDALILSQNETFSISNSSLEDIISGKVTLSKQPLGKAGLHLPK
ncbi:MAG: hypothetical protein QG574_4131 [Cyanobacteriota bacterium erpe_2018_sw_21hr_WHONDRS-SW48-000092_B_bin.40]|nr:hypothetical protein [Cyanobacteriota bacterium erpe_2018_sw_21hr_WHONDRS-SW48-000092_B_bin.40]